MSGTKFDARQTISRDVLDQLAAGVADAELDNIIRSADSELTMPLRMRASATPDLSISIDAISVTNPEHGRNRVIPPISNTLPDFTSGTVTFPAASGGNITFSSGSDVALTVTAGNFIKVGIYLRNDGTLTALAGTEGATADLATAPKSVTNSFAMGYVVLENSGGTIQNVENSDIFQYVGGGSGGGGGLVTASISSSITAEGGTHYLTNTSSAAFSINLPAGEEGLVIRLTDASATWATNPVTLIPAAGDSIDDQAADETLLLDVKGTWIQFMWDNAQSKWVSDDIFVDTRDGQTEFKIPKVTAWQPYTPVTQGLGTITSNLEWRQVGENLEIIGRFTAGSTSAVEARLGLPNNYTVKSSSTSLRFFAGHGFRDINALIIYQLFMGKNGDDYLTIGAQVDNTNTVPLTPLNGSTLYALNDQMSIKVSVPVAEFAGDAAYETVIINEGSGGGLTTETLSSSKTLEAGVHYLSDTSAGAFTVTLPNGEAEAVIRISDATNSWDNNALTLTPAAGQSIDEGAADESLQLDVEGTWIQLMWDVDQSKWVSDDIFSATKGGTAKIKIPKVTNWEDFTPDFNLTSSYIVDVARRRQNGPDLEIEVELNITQIGTPSGNLIMTLPGSLNAIGPSFSASGSGYWNRPVASSGSQNIIIPELGSATDMAFRVNVASGGSSYFIANQNINNTDRISFKASVPVVEYSGDNAYDEIVTSGGELATTVKVPKTQTTSFTPDFGTLPTFTTDIAEYQQVAEYAKFTISISDGSGGSASQMSLKMPAGLTVDLVDNATLPLGSYHDPNNGQHALITGRYRTALNDFALYVQAVSGSSVVSSQLNGSNIVGNRTVNIQFECPIVEFSGDNAYEEFTVAAGGEGGEGEYNYIANPYAEAGTSGHTVSATTGSFTVARTTVAAELPGTKESAWALSGSGVTAGDYVAIESKRAIANADTAVGTFEVSVVDVNGSLSSDWKAQLYDVDNSQYVGSEIEFQGTGTYPADAFTQPGVTYEIHMIAKVASPALVAAEFALRSETTLLSSYEGPWQNFTPDFENGPSVTIKAASFRENGPNLEFKVAFNADANGTSGLPFLMKLPNNYTIDHDVISNNINVGLLGNGTWIDINVSTPNRFKSFIPVANLNESQKIRFYRNDGAGQEAIGGSTIGANDQFGFFASIPVVELRNNVTPTITEKLYDNARIKTTILSDTLWSDTAVLPLNLVSYSKGNIQLVNNELVVDSAGDYELVGRITLASLGSAGSDPNVAIRVNGVAVDQVYFEPETTGDRVSILIDSFLEELEPGDVIRIENQIGSNPTVEGGAIFTYVSLKRIPDTTGRAAGLPFPNGTLRLSGGNGIGSSSFIRRYSDIVEDQGDAFTYTDSATEGASIIVNRDMVASFSFADSRTDAIIGVGISKNASNINQAYSNLSSDEERLVYAQASTSQYCNGSITIKVKAGDVIRPHAQSSSGAYSSSALVTFIAQELYRLG